jgi:hypothetical protein
LTYNFVSHVGEILFLRPYFFVPCVEIFVPRAIYFGSVCRRDLFLQHYIFVLYVDEIYSYDAIFCSLCRWDLFLKSFCSSGNIFLVPSVD